MWLRALFFILILIVIVISLINIYSNERKETFVDTSKLHFEGSVHLNGGLKLNNIPNKIRTKQLCFRKTIDGEVKEECLDTGQFSFALNNSSERNYLKCLGEVCIDNKHMDILKNKKNFKIQNVGTQKCYTMRDVLLHGLGGNYSELTERNKLDSLETTGNEKKKNKGLRKLRGFIANCGRNSRCGGRGSRKDEWMPGKIHDDNGYGGGYTDGGSRNAPFIPNFVVGANCDLESDSTFKRFRNIQKKNQYRFIKTSISDETSSQTASQDTPVPEASSLYTGPMPGIGLNISN
jgi:hypothetical protein